MNKHWKTMAIAGVTALTLGAASVVTATSAEARGFGHDGAALGLGVAAGAIAAGSAYDYYAQPGYYGSGYYDDGYDGWNNYGNGSGFYRPDHNDWRYGY